MSDTRTPITRWRSYARVGPGDSRCRGDPSPRFSALIGTVRPHGPHIIRPALAQNNEAPSRCPAYAGLALLVRSRRAAGASGLGEVYRAGTRTRRDVAIRIDRDSRARGRPVSVCQLSSVVPARLSGQNLVGHPARVSCPGSVTSPIPLAPAADDFVRARRVPA